MRIGLDMLAVQSPHHARRGIGRYARNLASALLASPGDHRFVLHAHPDLTADFLPDSPTLPIRWVARDPDRGETSVVHSLDRRLRENPDGLDAFLVLSPFEKWESYEPPPRRRGGPILASVVYDLIPAIFQDEPDHEPLPANYVRTAAQLRRYDVLLAISEASRRDCLNVLALPEDRVVAIGGASDRGDFGPAPDGPMTEGSRGALSALGIDRPFILNVGGMDPRKNAFGLIDAFSRLPEPLRESHQLVLTFDITHQDRARLHWCAEDRGVGEALVVTGAVSDATLRVLYQRCAAFCFPSLYEGFGLPVLEALQSGAAVVAGNNSSQVEVAGDAALLANATDPGDVAEKLAQVLEQPGLAEALRGRALAQAERFSWKKTAALALEALASIPPPASRGLRRGRGSRPSRPRIAFLSPLAPMKSGVSDYSRSLLTELGETYTIDLFHDEGYVPDAAWGEESVCADARVFERVLPHKDYRAVVYQMGNSKYHRFLYPLLLRHPGVVTLHDFSLAGFHLWYGHTQGRRREHFAAELERNCPGDAEDLLKILDANPHDHEPVIAACARREAHLNGRIFERSEAVVVHSPWCLEKLGKLGSEDAAKAIVIPHGAAPTAVSPERRAAIRERFGLPADALVMAAFGFVHPDKMNPEVLRAFEVIAETDPSAVLLFVGQEADGGELRLRAQQGPAADRVRFFGRASDADYADLVAVTDLGFNLRRPPTNGETSGALLHLMRHGIATMVTDVGTFSDYPDDAVRKIRWGSGSGGFDDLLRAVRELVRDRRAREALGRAGLEHVRRHHDWRVVAARYVEVIERCHARRRRPGRPASAA